MASDNDSRLSERVVMRVKCSASRRAQKLIFCASVLVIAAVVTFIMLGGYQEALLIESDDDAVDGGLFVMLVARRGDKIVALPVHRRMRDGWEYVTDPPGWIPILDGWVRRIFRRSWGVTQYGLVVRRCEKFPSYKRLDDRTWIHWIDACRPA